MNAGETGLSNVNLDLIQDVNTNGLADLGEPVVASATTDTNGNYAFAAVTMGNYVVRETDLFGYYSTGDSLPPNDNQIGIAITAGLTTTTNNFFDRLLPTAVDDASSAPRNLPVIISPLTNDISPNGDALTITAKTNGAYTSSTVTISDGNGGTANATVHLTVFPLGQWASTVISASSQHSNNTGASAAAQALGAPPMHTCDYA